MTSTRPRRGPQPSRQRFIRAAALTLALMPGATLEAREALATEPAREERTTGPDFLLWRAPPGCSSAGALNERVRELLGEPELDPGRVRRMEGRVSETRAGWVLQLTLIDDLGRRERRLEAERCADLAEAAAVAITLAFEAARSRAASDGATPHPSAASVDATQRDASIPSVSTGAASAAAGNTAPASAAMPNGARTERATTESPASDARTAAGARLSPSAGAEIVIDTALPVVAPGARVFAAVSGSELELRIEALWLPDAERAVGPGQRVTFSLVSGGVRAGYAVAHGWVDTLLCLGIEAGRISARGSGLLNARSVHDLWLAPHAGLELRVRLGELLALHVRGEAIVPVLRQTYAVTDAITRETSADELAAIAARASVGAALSF